MKRTFTIAAIALGLVAALRAECGDSMAAAREAYEARRYEDAALHFERAASECPDRVRVLMDLASARMMARQPEQARVALLKLLAIDGRNAAALKLRGDAEYVLGHVPAAEASMVAAAEVEPANASIHYALGRIYYQEGRHQDAVTRFSRVIELDPKSYRAFDNLGLAYEALNETGKAMAAFKKAMDLSRDAQPPYDWVYGNMSSLLYKAGDYENAFQFGAEAAQRNPQSPRNFFLTGKALFRLNRLDVAEKWLGQSVKLDGTYPDARYQYSQVLRKLGRKEEADAQLEAFRELSKNPVRNRR